MIIDTAPDVVLVDGRDLWSPADVGGKAAGLARLARIGLRVPPAVALTTAASREYLATGALPSGFRDRIAAAVRQIETLAGLGVGSPDPLLVAVRSSPPLSMPGMLESVLDVGLTTPGVNGLVRRTGNPWLAWDAYRRLVVAFAETVFGLPAAPFETIAIEAIQRTGGRSLQDLDPVTLRDIAIDSRTLLATLSPPGLPPNPIDQIVAAVEAVLASWSSPKARDYRQANGIADDTGTGVLIQAMVFGNAGARSGAGVGFTRNPATGDDELYVDFAFNAQGEDIVSGRCAVTESAMLPDALPQVWSQLQDARRALEAEFRDMQEFEFTVEEGTLYFLQSRTAKRTVRAAVRIAADLVRDGVIDPATALERLATCDLDRVARTIVRPADGQQPIACATPATDGVASGRIVFDTDRARRLAGDGPLILLRPGLMTDDFSGLAIAAGIVTTFGGRTSHAAVLARQLGRVCLVGCADLRIDEAVRACTLGGHRLREGDIITIDGETGRIYAGEVPVETEMPDAALAEVDAWRRAHGPRAHDAAETA